jgi:hypothetical protein
MPELADQLRELFERTCPPVTLDEISSRCAALTEPVDSRTEPRRAGWRRARSVRAAAIAVLVLAVSGVTIWIVQSRRPAPTGNSRVTVAAGPSTRSKQHAATPTTRALPGSLARFAVGTGTPGGLEAANCGASTCVVSTGYGLGGDTTAGSTYVSRDAGHTWVPTALPSGVAMTTPVTCVNDTWCAGGAGLRDTATGDPAAGKAMRDPELLVTTDGGVSWAAHALPIPPNVQQLPASQGLPAETTYWPATVDAVACTDVDVCNVIAHVQSNVNGDGGFVADATIFLRTTDGGAQWAQNVLPRDATEVHYQTSGFNGSAAGLACPTASSCVAVVTYMKSLGGPQDVVAWRTDDNGTTWRESHLPGLHEVWPGLSCPTAGECWAVTDGALLHTLDGGATWSHVDPPPTGEPSPVPGATSWFSMSCTADDACFVAGNGISVTVDHGKTWTPLSLPDGITYVASISCEVGGFCIGLADPPGKPIIGGQGSALALTNGPLSRP